MQEGEGCSLLRNSNVASFLGKLKVSLKLTYGKLLFKNNVYHVPNICYNLMFVFQQSMCKRFECDKVILC